MKNKPNFFFFDNRAFPNRGLGGGGPLLGNFPHIIPFFSRRAFLMGHKEAQRRASD